MKKEDLDALRSAFAAGGFIAMGGAAALSAGGGMAGAVIFGAGLISTIVTGSWLFTGKIGYISKLKELPLLLGVLLCNFAMAILIGGIFLSWGKDFSMTARIDTALPVVFGKAAICGAWVYTAVEAYKRTTNVLTIVFPVAAFVISGAEHCIADAFYLTAAKAWSPYAALWLLVVTLGNCAGAIVLRLLVIKALPAKK